MQKTANEIAAEYGVHPTQIAQRKKQVLDGLPELFSTRRCDQTQQDEALIASLYQQIGQLKVQVDWLEKNQNHSIEVKRALVEPGNPELSIMQQCELLGLARSSYYYQPASTCDVDLQLMRLLDEQYTRTLFYGTRKMTAWLHTLGYAVDRKRVRHLLLMGLEAIYAKPRTSLPGVPEQRYPYLPEA